VGEDARGCGWRRRRWRTTTRTFGILRALPEIENKAETN
jgi:hypothetical protein